MLRVLLSCFLSFTVVGSTYIDIESEPKTIAYNPDTAISLEAKETRWFRVGFIGRHEMVQINEFEDLGDKCIQTLTSFYDVSALTNFHFSKSVTTVTTTTLSTTKKFSSEITTALQVQAGIPNVEISESKTVSHVYTIENTTTYTTSQSETFTTEYDVKQSVVDGKVFALGYYAHVYKLKCETWQWDDWWWGPSEVEGSREEITAYVTIAPYVSVVFR